MIGLSNANSSRLQFTGYGLISCLGFGDGSKTLNSLYFSTVIIVLEESTTNYEIVVFNFYFICDVRISSGDRGMADIAADASASSAPDII